MTRLPRPLLIATLVATLAACSEAPPPPAAPRLVRVLTVDAGGTGVEGAVRGYSGEVRARIETTLAFRTGGKIVERLVDAGSSVRPGQVLARLDPADTGLQAAQAEANRALAAAELARYRDLKSKNFISASALDAKETAFKAADAQAGLAKNQAGYTALVADRAGVIGLVLAEPGQVVTAGQAVFRMAPDGEREIAVSLPESEVAGFRLGQAAEVVLWSAGDAAAQKPIAGRLREVSPAADPVTRTFPARISLQGADPRLPLGMSATVRFPDAKRADGGIVLPLSAIYQQGSQHAVWKVDAGETARLQPVTLKSYGDRGAVVLQGLAAGDRIVAAGVNRLTEGEKLRVATVTADAK